MKTTPFWIDQFPRPADLPVAKELPTQVDVAVVGSGYTGLNAARVLAKSGATVAVLERETIGWGASSRNGGMATPGLKQGAKKIFKAYGEENGRLLWQSSIDAIDLIDEIVSSENINCNWQRNGHIALAYKRSHFEAMQKSAAWYKNKLGYDVTLVAQSDLQSEIGTAVFYGGMSSDFSGGLQPAKYVFGLARVAQKYGAVLCEKTAVTHIQKQPNGYQLHTSKGTLNAKEVVIATNGYTDRLIPQLKPRIFPVGSYIIVTEPLSLELQAKLSPKGRMFYDSKWFLNYFRLTPDGRLLWGGRNDLSTNLDLHESKNRLQKQMIHTFPELRNVPITHTWTGQLGITFDLMPHIGRVNGIHYALGYGGHGLSIATYLGIEIGLLLSGQKTSSPFAQIPHQTMFFYRNKPWFLPIVGRFFRLLDWMS
jgi:glycine/D-amino acid oxidase-like deaminating enzyme